MLASEVIKRLQELIAEHGDQIIIYSEEYSIHDIEYNHEEGLDPETCFLITS